ncbi:hypothetical protein F3Y22_tig00110383pilonHSYRG00095 [Hibiscus syriacus]|uniref:DUF4283 domain-containing protein n=1 Tax=Hibiscus syriacus TaxID=106335 RepID=A0A6A3AUV5_HIBSY|nr:hypothetical protein F3Y22_tig00110383pilonHSYRG00095 [Hibiscus syriacus]
MSMDALASNVGMREDPVSKENREGIPRKKSGLRNLWEMHILSDESDWVKRSLTWIIKTHFDLDLVMKGLASDGIKVKLAKWGHARNSCILTFASVEELKEAWSSRLEILSFWFEWLDMLLNEEGLPMWGKLICIQDLTVIREDMAVAMALLRVASPFDIPETVTLGSYERSYLVKINVGSVYLKQNGFLAVNSAVDDGGGYMEVATSEEGDDRYSGGVDEGQPSGERVSELPEENLNLRGEYLGLELRNNICYGSEKAQSDDFSEPTSINTRFSPSGPAINLIELSYGKQKEVELDNKVRSIEETKVEREVVRVQKVGIQVLGANQESFSNGLRSWSPLDLLSGSLCSRNVPIERWNRGSVSRVYRRSRVRKVWHNPSRKDEGLQIRELVVQNRIILNPILSSQSYLNSLVEGSNSIDEEIGVPHISAVDIAQHSGNVEEFSTGYILCSMPGRVSRSKRRLLIRKALDVVSFPTIYSSTFSLFLEEALAIWEVSKILGISFKEGKKDFLDKIINFEEGLAESRERGNSRD